MIAGSQGLMTPPASSRDNQHRQIPRLTPVSSHDQEP
jgi:hypothetical protein